MEIDYTKEQKARISTYLLEYITDHKKKRIDEVLNHRTRKLTLVLEDIFKPHNASAVIRTAECMGIQDIHIIQNTNPYTINPYVLRGAMKWLTVNNYGDGAGMYTPECFHHLREKGYKILATSVEEEATPIDQLQLSEKSAIVFGTEHTGISEFVKSEADELITIPMAGFTDSFNISVSAGIILSQLLLKLKESDLDWGLSALEKDELRFDWYKSIPPHAEEIIKDFLKKENTP